ncbi:hypothetical protein IV203_038853 [Nitzschia inconspicua]|nr:hypothetical protein IV203_038853 [Nitzschia inconspicua]
MKTRPKLIRILNPPPITGSSISSNGSNLAVTSRKSSAVALLKTHPSSGIVNNPTNQKIKLVTLHPEQPIVAYVLEGDNVSSNTATTSSSSSDASSQLLQKWIVVQHQHSRQVLWNMSVGEIASQLLSSKKESAADLLLGGETKLQRFAKDSLGRITRLEFLDPSSLYWNGFGTAPGSLNEEDALPSTAAPLSSLHSWSYLMVQFQTRILIFNLRRHASGVFPPNSGNKGDAIASIVTNITADSLASASSTISSNALAVGETSLVVACGDGSIKVYDWKAGKVIQSVNALGTWTVGGTTMTKLDYIVEVVSANPFAFHPAEHYDRMLNRPLCMVCVTKKGAAYVVSLTKSTTGGSVNIGKPLALLEGGSVPPSILSKQDDDASAMEHIYCAYDGFRDIFLWLAPAKVKSKLFAWDLSNIADSDKRKQHQSGDKPDPTLVVQFPYENLSHMVYPAWFHESTPKEYMTCVVVTKDGDVQVLVAPLSNTGSTAKHPFMAYPICGVNLIRLAQRDLELPEERTLIVRPQSIQCPPLRDQSTFVVATNMGLFMVKFMDGNLVPFPGTRHAHFSANFGTMGRAVLYVKGAQLLYSPLEPEGGILEVNPVGRMEYGAVKGTVVYESPPPLHLPPEIHKRPIRLPPCFLPSPSRNYMCCFWKEEMRYEILSVSSMMERVTNRAPNSMVGNSPVVASGTGVASFAWVGDEDVFCLLYDPEQDLALKVGIDLNSGDTGMDTTKVNDLTKLKELARLKTYKKGMKTMVGTAGKLKSLEGLRDLGKDTGKIGLGAVKGVKKLSMGTVKLTGKVALGTTAAAQQTAGKVGAGATKTMTKMAVGSKMGAKKLGFVWGKKKGQDKKSAQGSLATAEIDEEDEAEDFPAPGTAPIVSFDELDADDKGSELLEKKYPWVEMRVLVGGDGNAFNTTASNLGTLTLRSGNRNPPTILFGGPVLCVGSKLDELDEGLAYFYTKRKGQEEESASAYVSSGPAFPCPDFVAWDDEGKLCAVVIQGRVSIYLSDEPNFVLLGTSRLRCGSDIGVEVISCRFLHGVLYCTTRSTIQCIFVGDLDGGICHLDSFVLASSEISTLPSKSILSDYKSLFPPTIPMPLVHPEVLGYQNGSLVLSTVSGIIAVPLGFPLIRIGSLICAGSEHYPKAEKWFDAVPNHDHEVLADFLERRGVPELALSLPGISLETIIDFSMRYGCIDRLEEALEMHGLMGLRAIDMSRGLSSNVFGPEEDGVSILVCVGAYLLSHGRVEMVRRLATECLDSGEESKQEAFLLANLLLSVSGSDAKRVIQRSVEDVEDDGDWVVGSFVKQHIL